MEIDREALLQTFVAETAEHLDALEEALLDLERRPDARHLVERIFRITHTLKGNAGSVGLHALGDLGHAAEDVIEDALRGAAPVANAVISLLLETVDASRRLLAAVPRGEQQGSPTHEVTTDIVARLREARLRAQDEPPWATPRSAVQHDADEGERGSGARSIRVAVEKLDRMADLIGEVAVSRNRIARGAQAIGGAPGAALRDDIDQLERLYSELEEVIRRARMIPVGPWFRQYERTVRDLARAHGKQARLVVVHGDVEVDTAVIERLRDALTHLLRNAIDHGIEPPEVRLAAGKDACGTITLRASHEGGGIALRIADDGGGMSRARIAAQVRAGGLCPDPESLPDGDLFGFVFEPGLSTAPVVSELSGRGVGMDIVRRRVESLQGSIRIESRDGVGATLTVRLPLTLATIEGFSVGVGAERYVVPLRAVIACVELPRGAFARGSRGVIHLRGRALPCVRVRELFALGGAASSQESVVVVAYEGGQAGLVVDRLDGESRTVIKPLGRLFRRIPGITGSTILGDGKVALILDVDALLGDVTRGALEAPPLHGGQSKGPEEGELRW